MAQLQERLAKAEELWHQYDEIQSTIEDLQIQEGAHINQAGVYVDSNEQQIEDDRSGFEDTYFETITKAKQLLETRQARPEPSEAMHSCQSVGGSETPTVKVNVKLPTLNLPTFDGSYSQWMAFKDTFQSLIDTNDSLSLVEKFQYLRSSLKGEAQQVIQALETSAANYKAGWTLLKSRYENKRLIVNTHMKELVDYQNTNKESQASLRKLVDHIRTHMRALQTMGQPVEQWDTIMIYIVTSKLDFNTRKDWESKIGVGEVDSMPTMDELLEFLTNRCQTLEMIEKSTSKQDTFRCSGKRIEKKVAMVSTAQELCQYCKGSHFIFRCSDFISLPTQSKYQEIRRLHLCFNCLKNGHSSKDCRSSACRKCSKRHNTLLHHELEKSECTSTSETKNELNSPVVTHCTQGITSLVILSTAQVSIYDSQGKTHKCRALLDPGSQVNLITKELAHKLGLACKTVKVPISGVNKIQSNVSNKVEVKIGSIANSFKTNLECLVLPAITEKLPQVKIKNKLEVPSHIQLADPTYDIPGNIDLLIGASHFWKLLCVGQITVSKNHPILQKTVLGWIIGGELVNQNHNKPATTCHLHTTSTLEHQMEKFWRTEEILPKSHLTKSEEMCEEQFVSTVRRDQDGRFIVGLPKKAEVSLGDSKNEATRRLYSLERRLSKNTELKKAYNDFLDEYEILGHMSPYVPQSVIQKTEPHYLPHQPVIRANSLTTKMRVVFDASARTTQGTSLNDKLLVGPNLQEDILDIMMRFRIHEYVITADIAMMFRQIMVAKEDRNLQCILWRKNQSEIVQTFTLNTVTYGTSCAPFLAMRCLKQLALDEHAKYPTAARALLRDFYMDDVLTGAHSLDETVLLQKQLTQLLSKGKFILRKWRSSDPHILHHLSEESKADPLLVIDKQEAVKTLGTLWNSGDDSLQYRVIERSNQKITKRNILSSIAQIYDPLGLIGPILITAKVIMQNLWKLQLGWDEAIPQSLYTTWTTYYTSLPQIDKLHVPRNVNPQNKSRKIELHGFCDSSEKAYGACVYVLSYNVSGEATVNLLCSKSRVAPLKIITIPRLELNAAVLLSRLIAVVRRALEDKVGDIYLWSDSTIILCWIKKHPSDLKTYVANRVAEIQDLTNDMTWLHVPTLDNPADHLSRGIKTEKILENELWWKGPSWLPERNSWPEQAIDFSIQTPEQKPAVTLSVMYAAPDVLNKFSSYDKLKRVIAYCLRFINLKKENHQGGSLTVEELQRSEYSIIRMVQREVFSEEIKSLKKNQPISTKSKLHMLKPFLDTNGLIRVGGRLQNAEISISQKHQIILPSRHFITEIIMRREHHALKHCGPEHLLNVIRQIYWPLSGRREARKITKRCIPCFRYKPRKCETIMADLPRLRVTDATKPFETCGIDYAGPLQVRESKRKGRIHISKAYIAVFTCFHTKAIHLELVSDLTTEAFMAALRRFIARRGTCSFIYSDNATNFVGAEKELRDIHEFAKNHDLEISDKLAAQKIRWKFIPPRSPHFGGLWEAAVKSTKRHLRIAVKDVKYTFEEYYTLLTEIEAVLNSRPLTPISSDPNDLSILTPAHFLTGDSYREPVQRDYINVPESRLSRWQHLQKLRQHFWNRWRNEYLNHLQTICKWRKGEVNLAVGSMVLLVDENTHPCSWSVGRVVDVHPGADGIVRVATIKTASGIFKRATRKLCALPMDPENNECQNQ